MCGRYSVTLPPEALRQLFRYRNRPNLRARYNVAPTQSAPVVRHREAASADERELAELRWGLVPNWAKSVGDGPLLINARLETVAEKPAFRSAFRSRRCLVPADGFYEWKREDKAKQPFRIHPKDGSPVGFAGLWEHWQGTDGEAIESFAILTTEAEGAIREIHDRMPVMLDPSAFDAWLDPALSDPDLIRSAIKQIPVSSLAADPVSTYVNAVRNDDVHCFDPPEPVQQTLF